LFPEGFDKGCQEDIFRTLEVKYPDNRWETVWHEQHDADEGEYCYYPDTVDGTI
jgi:hypothetical protein